MATGTSFIIEELTGPKRKIELFGRCLPFRPVSFTGKQRTELTWYPGNPRATAQVFGPEEEPFTLNGKWDDRYLNDTEDGTYAKNESEEFFSDVVSLVKGMDAIRKAGQEVKVTWGVEVFYGILSRFQRQWNHLNEVLWEVEVSVMGLDEAQSGIQLRPSLDYGSIVSGLTYEVELVFEYPTFFDVPDVPLLSFWDALMRSYGQLIDDINGALNDMEDAVTSFTNKVMQPFELTRRLITTLGGVVGRLRALYDGVRRKIALIAKQLTTAALDATTGILSMTKWTRRYAQNVKKAEIKAVNAINDLSKNVDLEIKATVIADEGQNLREISRTYYGTPEYANVLKSYNKLASTELKAGTVVYVPNSPDSYFARNG